MNNLTPTDIGLLKEAADATTANSMVYKTPAIMAVLQTALLVEGNPNFVDPANPGAIAFRATAAGLAAAQNYAAAASAPAASAPAASAPAMASAPGQPPVVVQPPAPGAAAPAGGVFQVGGGFVLPEKVNRRPSNTGRTYPFEDLQLNGWIFVPATDKKKDPKKSLASTISGANKRYENFVPRRYFKAVRATAGQKFGDIVAPSNGAYIVRVEPPVEAPATAGAATA